MDFDLSPWADEPETYKPEVRKLKRREKTPFINETKSTKLPQLMPAREEIKGSADYSNIPQPENLKSLPLKGKVDCFYSVSPIELRAKLVDLVDSHRRLKMQHNRLQSQPHRSLITPVRRLEQLIDSSIRQLNARSTSPHIVNSSFYIKGSKPQFARLKPL